MEFWRQPIDKPVIQWKWTALHLAMLFYKSYKSFFALPICGHPGIAGQVVLLRIAETQFTWTHTNAPVTHDFILQTCIKKLERLQRNMVPLKIIWPIIDWPCFHSMLGKATDLNVYCCSVLWSAFLLAAASKKKGFCCLLSEFWKLVLKYGLHSVMQSLIYPGTKLPSLLLARWQFAVIFSFTTLCLPWSQWCSLKRGVHLQPNT